VTANDQWLDIDLSHLGDDDETPEVSTTPPATPLWDQYMAMTSREKRDATPQFYAGMKAEGDQLDAWNAGAAATEEVEPFKILTRADLRAMPRVSWLIGGLVQTSGIVVLAGDGGIGKSAVVIDWAACIASGRPTWHGKTVLQGSVLYVAGEGVEGFEDRLDAWEQVTGTLIPDERMHYVAEGFSLSDEKAVDLMRRKVLEEDYALVILDTFSQLSAVENENDNSEVARVLSTARAIRQARPGCTVIIVHHVSKNGAVRGASAIRNNADAVIVAKADSGMNVSTFTLSTEHEHQGKQKNGTAESIDGFWLDSVGNGVVVKRGGADDLSRAVLSVLADRLPHSGPDFYIAAVAPDERTQKEVRRRLHQMVTDGSVIVSGSGKARRWQSSGRP
jgi:hypothetical protein